MALTVQVSVFMYEWKPNKNNYVSSAKWQILLMNLSQPSCNWYFFQPVSVSHIFENFLIMHPNFFASVLSRNGKHCKHTKGPCWFFIEHGILSRSALFGHAISNNVVCQHE